MSHNEIIYSFLSHQYEDGLHQQFLAREDFELPQAKVKNFMVQLTDISLTEIFNYMDNHPSVVPVASSSLSTFSALEACTDELCALLVQHWPEGRSIAEIGEAEVFQKYLRVHNKSSWSRFGNNHAKTAHQLGLTFKADRRWYLSCYGYIYAYFMLSKRQQARFLTRALLRNPFYAKVLTQVRLEEVHVKDYLPGLSSSTLGARSGSIARLLQLVLQEMDAENIKWHDLYLPKYNARRKELTESVLQGTFTAMDN